MWRGALVVVATFALAMTLELPGDPPATGARAVPVAAAARLSPVAAPADWRPDVRAAERWARTRAGEVSFAVRTEHRLFGRRFSRQVPSASVIKAMLLAAYMRQPSVRRRGLRDDERALLSPMIRWSDNDAASAVFVRVGAWRVMRFARRVGMTDFEVDPWWGRSRITAADQTRLFLRFDRWLPRRHRSYGMRLLRTIVPGQRWGIARVAPEGWRLSFKGGWGDGSGSINHQVALLQRDRVRVSIAVLTTGNPSHAYGSETLRGVARRLLRGLARHAEPAAGGAVRGSRSRCCRRP
jgi:hypothetical protein